MTSMSPPDYYEEERSTGASHNAAITVGLSLGMSIQGMLVATAIGLIIYCIWRWKRSGSRRGNGGPIVGQPQGRIETVLEGRLGPILGRPQGRIETVLKGLLAAAGVPILGLPQGRIETVLEGRLVAAGVPILGRPQGRIETVLEGRLAAAGVISN